MYSLEFETRNGRLKKVEEPQYSRFIKRFFLWEVFQVKGRSGGKWKNIKFHLGRMKDHDKTGIVYRVDLAIKNKVERVNLNTLFNN